MIRAYGGTSPKNTSTFIKDSKGKDLYYFLCISVNDVTTIQLLERTNGYS